MEEFDFIETGKSAAAIQYKLQYNRLASRKAGRNVYSAHVIPKEGYGTVQLAKALACRGALLKESQIRMIISELANLIGELVSEGRPVNIGGVVRFLPVIHGTFASPDEAWDPKKHKVRVAACVGGRMRKIAEQSPVSRVGAPEVPVLTEILNTTGKTRGSISSHGAFVVLGTHLSWDIGAEDEGWFINLGGTESKCDVTDSESPFTSASLQCTRAFDAPGTSLLLIFRTRLGGKTLHQIAYSNPLVSA